MSNFAATTTATTAEKVFQMNLMRLTNNSLILTFDNMLELLSYINANSILELQFVEQHYLSSILSNPELESLSSIQELSELFEEAKNKNDFRCLKFIRQAHRQAITFVDNSEIKAKLQEIAHQRKTQKEYQAYNAVLISITDFMKNHPNNRRLINSLSSILPQLFDNLQLIENNTNPYEPF